MHYNFCWIHKTLRVTPAMEAGLTDLLGSLEEVASLLDEKTKRGCAYGCKTKWRSYLSWHRIAYIRNRNNGREPVSQTYSWRRNSRDSADSHNHSPRDSHDHSPTPWVTCV